MPTFFGEGNLPRVHDTRWRILQKILGALTGSGTGGGGIGGLINRAAPTGTYGVDEPPPSNPTIVWDLRFVNEMPGLRWQPDALHANGGYWIGYA